MNNFVKFEEIAVAVNEIIGESHFVVSINDSLDIQEQRVPVTLRLTRMPYKLENINSEQINAYLVANIECSDENMYMQMLNELMKLVGYTKGTLTSGGKTYSYHFYFDFAQPVGNPVISMGTFRQTVNLTGTMLLTAKTGGAMVGNEVETTFIFNPDTDDEISGTVEVLNASDGVVKQTESVQMANSTVAYAYNQSQGQSYSYQILILKDKIGKRIVQAVKNIKPFELNEKMTIKEVFPSFDDEDDTKLTSTNNVVITNIQMNRNAGAYTTATITMQDILELDT